MPASTQDRHDDRRRARPEYDAHVLYALDAETGQELYSSKDLIDDWTHLSSVTVADGSVYVTTRKTIVYAFGLNK